MTNENLEYLKSDLNFYRNELAEAKTKYAALPIGSLHKYDRESLESSVFEFLNKYETAYELHDQPLDGEGDCSIYSYIENAYDTWGSNGDLTEARWLYTEIKDLIAKVTELEKEYADAEVKNAEHNANAKREAKNAKRQERRRHARWCAKHGITA